jgi:predicted RNase H-like nuclease (RuvC/YqgF family)
MKSYELLECFKKMKQFEEENEKLKNKIQKIKNSVIETIQELNSEKSEYQVSEHAKRVYENEIWVIDQKLNILEDILGELY